jgi:hypothetical protein
VKVIFDENVPLPLQQFLAGHAVTTVQQEGWAGIENGDLLKIVDGKFDVLVLADKNLRYQQDLTTRRIALVELPTNRWPALKRLVARIAQGVESALPGSYTVIEP